MQYLFLKNEAMPVYLSVFVTNQCNYRCQHCFYWKSLNTNTKEISQDEFQNLSKSIRNIVNLSISGGEPFIREDIDAIASIFYKNSKPLVITIVTNGYSPEHISGKVKSMFTSCPRMPLTILISLDGKEKLHDTIRGVRGAYKNAIATYKSLKMLKGEHPSLNVGFLSTLSLENYSTFQKFFEKTVNELQPDSFNVNYLRGSPRDTKISPLPANSYDNILKLTAKYFSERNLHGYSNFRGALFYHAANLIFRKILLRTIRNPRYYSPCYAGILNGVVYPNGDVHACEIKDTKMGNLNDYNFDLKKLWASDKANQIKKEIKKQRCFCTHECQLTTNTIFNLHYFIKIFYVYLKLKLGL